MYRHNVEALVTNCLFKYHTTQSVYSKNVASPDEHDSFACEVMCLNNDSVWVLISGDMISHHGC